MSLHFVIQVCPTSVAAVGVAQPYHHVREIPNTLFPRHFALSTVPMLLVSVPNTINVDTTWQTEQ